MYGHTRVDHVVCVYSDVLILYIVSLTSLGLLSYLYHFPISLLHASNTLLLMQCLAMLFFFFFLQSLLVLPLVYQIQLSISQEGV